MESGLEKVFIKVLLGKKKLLIKTQSYFEFLSSRKKEKSFLFVSFVIILTLKERCVFIERIFPKTNKPNYICSVTFFFNKKFVFNKFY